MTHTIQVAIDRDACTQCQICWDVCPAVFSENEDDGSSQIIGIYQINGNPAQGEVPAEHKDCAIEAAEGCPVDIIEIKS